MYVNDIIKCTNGILVNGGNIKIEDFSIDTRTINKGEMFISISGDNFNANDFILDAFKKNAIGVIYQGDIDNRLLNDYKDRIFIKVTDTIVALQDMASFKRSLYNIPIVAITGSVGKTSTKDMVSEVMSRKYNVLKTFGNFNNHIGLPLTLLKLKDHNAMCIEMGMNHFGEISLLTNILKPSIAIITNVGTSHIGNLGSRENILKAKLEILEGLTSKTVIINNDNDLLNKWNKENDYYDVLTFGINEHSDYMAKDIKLDVNCSSFKVGDNVFNVGIPGKHFIYNSLCAITVGSLLNIDIEDIKSGILGFELSKNRMEIKKINDDITILIDCYNANFDSMKAAIEVLGNFKERKIAVLGDMLELGEFSEKLHKDVGYLVDKNNIDILITVGENAKYIYNTSNITNKYWCMNNDDAIRLINDLKYKNDVILLKASNGMKFIEILNNIS